MFKDGLKFWLIPIGLWALFSCWYFGYQSGYSDGTEAAWNMYHPPMLFGAVNNANYVADSDAASEIEMRR